MTDGAGLSLVHGIEPAPREALPETKRVALSSGAGLRRLVIGVVVVYLVIVLIAPIAALLVSAWQLGVPALIRAMSESDATSSLFVSLVLAACGLLINGLFGLATAMVLVRDRYVLAKPIRLLLDVSLAISPIMAGLSLLLLYGRGGWFEGLSLFGVRVPFAFPGLILATLFVTLPYVPAEVSHMLREVGTEEESAASTLGASAWRTFRRITLPNVRSGLVVGGILTVTRALGEFGAVIVIGGAISGKTQTATTFIYGAVEERQRAGAIGMALILASVSIIALAVVEILKRTSRSK